MSDKYAGNPNKSLEFLFYGRDPIYPDIFTQMGDDGYPDLVIRDQMSIPKYVPVSNSVYAADYPRIKDFY